MALTVSTARALDFLEVHTVEGAIAVRHRRMFGLVARMVEGSETITVRDPAGRLCVVAGLYPGDDGAEAWFGSGPALAANLLATVRLVRRVLDHIATEAPGLVVDAHVNPRSVAGDRLARWLGFTAAGVTDHAFGPLRTWRRCL